MALTDGINHVATVTDDLDRLVGFYQRVFEAEKLYEDREEGLRHALIRLGGATVLHPFELPHRPAFPAKPLFERGRLDHLALSVPTLESFIEVRHRLLDEGVSDGVVRDIGPLYSLGFADPDGVEVEVILMKGDWLDQPVRRRVDWETLEFKA